jgi:hypothetical protein
MTRIALVALNDLCLVWLSMDYPVMAIRAEHLLIGMNIMPHFDGLIRQRGSLRMAGKALIVFHSHNDSERQWVVTRDVSHQLLCAAGFFLDKTSQSRL